ncbi:MAG: hypothetical protein PHV23_01395 [Candidatus Gracilibacteria bacterium]|nr:hypothetical protein [Candidatus Gracilibacteria bacterium]
MKKFIVKFFDSLINIIEKYEDYKYGYHINLETGKFQFGNFVIK